MQIGGSIYECKVWHERTTPRPHSFSTGHFMLYLPLDEILSSDGRPGEERPRNKKNKRLRLLGVNKANLLAFFEADHLPDVDSPSSTLIQRVKSAVVRLGVEGSIERIDLLTNVRIFGYVFNPVSFFFCFGAGKKLTCCLCEVGNTFGEKKLFLVRPDHDGLLKDRQKKYFYVSPFADLQQDFCFDIGVPGESLNIRIDTVDGDTSILQAGIKGTRADLSDINLARSLFFHPWATVKVIALIHLHALLLWSKRVPFHGKDERLDLQLDVLHRRQVGQRAMTLRKGRNR